MDPYYVSSVWSFNGPSRHDGFVLVRYANLIGLSQYPVFKVQAAADSLHILRFCPLRAACLAFGGKEIQYALALRLSTGCLKFFRAPREATSGVGSRKQRTPPGSTGRRQSVAAPHTCGCCVRYGFDLRSHLLVFNTRSSVSADSQRRGVVLYQRPPRGARG